MLQALVGMSKMAGESGTLGTLYFSWFLALAWDSSGILLHHVSHLH